MKPTFHVELKILIAVAEINIFFMLLMLTCITTRLTYTAWKHPFSGLKHQLLIGAYLLCCYDALFKNNIDV